MKLELSKGVRTAQGGAQTRDGAEQKLRIPSNGTAFQIESIEATSLETRTGEPEQVLILNTTADISSSELAKAIQIRLLPKREAEKTEESDSEGSDSESAAQTDENDESRQSTESEEDESEETTESDNASKWQSPTDVPDDVLEQAKRIEFTVVPSEKAQDRQHAFKIRVESEGELYVRVPKGVRAFGDYPLAEDYNAVVQCRSFRAKCKSKAKAVCSRSMATGNCRSVHALCGRSNSKSRALPRRKSIISLARPKENSRTRSSVHRCTLTRKTFRGSRSSSSRSRSKTNGKSNYSAFDFAEHLRKPADGGSERGLFFLTARGWDPAKKKPINSARDSRFLLITDIGILTKKNTDGSSDVFLMSIKKWSTAQRRHCRYSGQKRRADPNGPNGCGWSLRVPFR